jgi:hypothetical protein
MPTQTRKVTVKGMSPMTKGTRDEISRHEVAVYRTLGVNAPRWMTNAEIATAAGVARRTARLHTHRYARLGLIERAALFPRSPLPSVSSRRAAQRR